MTGKSRGDPSHTISLWNVSRNEIELINLLSGSKGYTNVFLISFYIFIILFWIFNWLKSFLTRRAFLIIEVVNKQGVTTIIFKERINLSDYVKLLKWSFRLIPFSRVGCGIKVLETREILLSVFCSNYTFSVRLEKVWVNICRVIMTMLDWRAFNWLMTVRLS